MFVSEVTANSLWCPQARGARIETAAPEVGAPFLVVVAGCNTDALGGTRVPSSSHCIASRCAMWRWHKDVAFFPLQEKFLMPNQDPAKGYCGLAGKPAYK